MLFRKDGLGIDMFLFPLVTIFPHGNIFLLIPVNKLPILAVQSQVIQYYLPCQLVLTVVLGISQT